MKPIYTNIGFTRELWEEAKIYAIRKGISLSMLVRRAVAKYLKENK